MYLHFFQSMQCLWPKTAPRFYCMLFLFLFVLPHVAYIFTCPPHLATGGPDPPPHCLPFRENWHRPAVAAAHGSPRRCHHQRLHAPAHLSQGRPGRDHRRPAGGWSVALDGHKGKRTSTCSGMKSRSVIKNTFCYKDIVSLLSSWTNMFSVFPFCRKDSLHYM